MSNYSVTQTVPNTITQASVDIIRKLLAVRLSPTHISNSLNLDLELIQKIQTEELLDPEHLRRYINQSMEDSMKFRCPFSHRLMIQPVCAKDGMEYDSTALRLAIEEGRCRTFNHIADANPNPSLRLKNEIRSFSLSTLSFFKVNIEHSIAPVDLCELVAECLSVLSLDTDQLTYIQVIIALRPEPFVTVMETLRTLVSSSDLLPVLRCCAERDRYNTSVTTLIHEIEAGLASALLENTEQLSYQSTEVIIPMRLAESSPLLADKSGEVKQAQVETKQVWQFPHASEYIYTYKRLSSRLYRTHIYTKDSLAIEIPNFKFKTACVCTEVPGAAVFVTGGSSSSEVVSIDLATFAVTPKASMISVRSFHAATYSNNFIYVVGGQARNYLRACERYSCHEDLWTPLPDLPNPGIEMSAVVLESLRCLYVLGGRAASGPIFTVQRLQIDLMTWDVMGVKLPSPGLNLHCFKISEEEAGILIEDMLFMLHPASESVRQIADIKVYGF